MQGYQNCKINGSEDRCVTLRNLRGGRALFVLIHRQAHYTKTLGYNV